MKGNFLKKLTILSLLVSTTVSLISCSNETVVNSVENIIPEKVQAQEVEKQEEEEKINYLPLGVDPFADDALTIQERLLNWDFVDYDGKKTVYLTFDDGPSSKITDEILDVLKEKDVKGTFFVLGNMIDKNKKSRETLLRIANEGHAIANHGYNHVYTELYPNDTCDVDAFMADMNKSLDSMKAVLGPDFHTRVIRFPGGHSTWYTDDIDKHLEENNYAFVDWNSLNNDALGVELTAEEAFENLKTTVSEIEGNNDVLVVLMHDTDNNQSNPEYLRNAIDYLKGLGYEFRTLK